MAKHNLTNQQLCTLKTPEGHLQYFFVRSSRRKTIEIAIQEDGTVCVKAPRFSPEEDVHDFLILRQDWIRTHSTRNRLTFQHAQIRDFVDGQSFLYLGKEYRLSVIEDDVKRSRIVFNPYGWFVTVPRGLKDNERKAQIRHRLVSWYKDQAKEVLAMRIFLFGRIMEEDVSKLMIKTQRRIWGSCDSRTRTIYLNWQLILAPMGIIDYVVVHELSHLKEPNHSQDFWKRVASFMPDYKTRVQWLKQNTANLSVPDL